MLALLASTATSFTIVWFLILHFFADAAGTGDLELASPGALPVEVRSALVNRVGAVRRSLVSGTGVVLQDGGATGNLSLAPAANSGNDLDDDGIQDELDNCVAAANNDQSDLDNDGEGDACDTDDDGDGLADDDDAYPLDATNGFNGLSCIDQAGATANLDGNSYLDGGRVSDGSSNILNLCGVLNEMAVDADVEIRLSVELSSDAAFALSPPSLTVTGGLQWALAAGGDIRDSTVTWSSSTGQGQLPANQTFEVDIQAVVVAGPEDVLVTVRVEGEDGSGTIELFQMTETYIDFSPVVIDQDGDGIIDDLDNCSVVANHTQTDTDGDNLGDVCDNDDDGDGVLDNEDAFPLDPLRSGTLITGRVYLQTTSLSENVSLSHIINTSDGSQIFTGSLYDSSGGLLGDEKLRLHLGEIKPNQRLILSSEALEDLFGTAPWSGPALLEVQGTNSFRVMTKLTSPSGLVSNTNCVRQAQVHNVEGSNSPDVSYIRLINIGDVELGEVKGTLYNHEGEIIGAGSRVLVSSLGPRQQVWVNRDDLERLVGVSWAGEASLRIESPPDHLRLLNLIYTANHTFFNFSCYETGAGP